MQEGRFMFVAALEGIHQDRESWMSQSCPEIEEHLETSTQVKENEQEGQKIDNQAHNNSQYKVRQVLFT